MLKGIYNVHFAGLQFSAVKIIPIMLFILFNFDFIVFDYVYSFS